MRLTVFLLVFSVIQVWGGNSYSQITKLSLNLKDVTVQQVLDEIENLSEFYFLYSGKLVDITRKVDIDVKNKRIKDILSDLFTGEDINCLVMDRQILLSPKYITERVNVTRDRQPQEIVVKGKVTDEDGNPLPGVNIIIKGTITGTITDLNGNYSIEVEDTDATLVISFVGMLTQEVAVRNQTSIDITMHVDVIGLEEVVAIGYGFMRKSDLTGSVTRVNVEELAELPNVSVIQAMQGTVAGLNVSAVDQAGENPTISIRGLNSLSTSSGANAPLMVVDGIIYRGSLIDLNTADIESIDILKDASSAAIFGSQASNGVMLITTKKAGVSSKPIINYSGSYTLQVPSNKLDPMNGAELTEFFPDIFWELGSRVAPDYLQQDPAFSIVPHLKTNEIVEGFASGLDTDWWGGLTGNGYINTHNLSIRGKTNTLGYFVSGGMTDVKGFVENDNYKRYNYRINLDTEINDWMKVGLNSFLTSSDYSGMSPSLGAAFHMQPWTPIYDENGEIYKTPEGGSLNPYLYLQMDDSDRRLNIFANIHADIKLPINGLSYKINFSQNYRTTRQDGFNPWGASYTGSGYKNSYINYDWTVDNIITYKKTFNDVHNLNGTLVYGVEKRDYSSTTAGAQNFVNDLLGYYKLEVGEPTLRSLNTGKEQEQSLYSMARLLYNYNKKYLITATVRRDGFSGFGTEDKIGVFPSVALGWVASEEYFIENVDWLNYLKLRGSYGSTGRRAGGRYDTRAIVSAHPSIVFGDGGSATQGQWISSMANNQLGWETTTGLNIGADFAILNSKLRGNIEYYDIGVCTKDIRLKY